MTYDQEPEYKAMDETIRAYFKGLYPDHLTTDWIVLGTGLRVSDLPDDVTEAYKLQYQHSNATGYHAMLGLLADANHQFLNAGNDE